jgi:surface polysaccharide O-acyltransferase-like enzyme
MPRSSEAPSSLSPVARSGRDHAIDLVRALCVTAVVVLHSLMVGVTVAPDGPVFANAGDAGWWLVPVSWVLQVMPLFFVIGGFAGLKAYERMPEGSATAFVTARLHRLLLPAVGVIGTAGVGLAALTLTGVPDDLVEVAGFRFGQPLWFLAVFLLAQALLPALVRAHRTAPFITLGALAAGAVAVDIARAATGIDAIGFLNLGFVWLTMQQLGFLLADGRIDALSRRARVAIGATALAALATTFITGAYSPDLIANSNPPTAALLLVGVVHTAAFSLLRAPIAAFAERARPRAFTEFVSQRAMTIYLWHMSVLLVLAGGSALLATAGMLDLPAPASPEWWLGRPVWLALVLGITALISLPLSRMESLRLPRRSLGAASVSVAATLGTAAVVLLLVRGTSTTTVIAALTAMVAALAIVTPLPSLEVQRMVQRAARVEGSPASGALGGRPVLLDRHAAAAHSA